MNKICFGCGSILQCDNELNPGYIPESKIDNANYCKRCFRLTHYGEISNNELEKSTKSILDNVNKDNIFKIYIVDILNINDSTMSIFNKIKGNKLLLINKVDLIPKDLNKDKILSRIKNIYNIKCDIKYISSIKEYGINSLIKYLEKKNIYKSYILGPTNSGKSTLLNKLIEIYNPNMNKLTVSNKRNTTLEFVRIKLGEITLIDSPGFLIDDYDINSKYKNIIKPVTFNMKDGEILFIDRFCIKFSNNTSVTIYTSDSINIKKYYKEIDFNYDIKIDDNIDLCINGFGFINIKNRNNISISGIDKKLISIRNSVFGDNYE